jgi:hypothetical protein
MIVSRKHLRNFGVVLGLAIGILILITQAYALHTIQARNRLPVVNARVTALERRNIIVGSGKSLKVAVPKCQFIANGQQYTIIPRLPARLTRSQANFLKEIDLGNDVQLRFDPAHPQNSVLIDQSLQNLYIQLAIGFLITIVSLVVLVFTKM